MFHLRIMCSKSYGLTKWFKVLFELEGEDDRLSLLQASLLMVHWQDFPGGEKDASYWIGICLSLAGSIGLRCSPDSIAMTPNRRRAWKRTWWCVYSHARLTSKDLLTMMSIVDEPCENGYDNNGIFMTTLSGLKFGVLPPTAQAVAGGCEVLRNVEYQKTSCPTIDELQRPVPHIDQYDDAIESLSAPQAQTNGKQPGDASLAVESMLDAVRREGKLANESTLPFRMVLGSDALEIVRNKCAGMLNDLERYEELAQGTDIPGADMEQDYK